MQVPKISLFFRKKSHSAQSIEMLFNNIIEELSKKQTEVVINKHELPNYSRSIYDFFKNIFFAFSNSAEINHITGDVHYIFILLNPKRTILTIHDCILLEHKKGSFFYWLYKLIWYEMPMKYCKTITTISEKSKRELLSYIKIDPNKIKVINNFYDPIFQYTPRKFNSKLPTFLQVGTTPNKNLEMLIDVLKDIKCRLIIVGELSTNQKNRLSNSNIDFNNYFNITKQHLYELYVTADIVTFISTYEGFGLPLIEGNAVGRVVISSFLSPMKEVGRDSAHLVDPFDKNDIKDGIIKLISDENYRDKLIENGQRNIKRFRLEAVAENYLELYQSIMN